MDFTKLQEEIKAYDAQREDLIKKSRDVLKLSKLLIYAVHREELDKAETFLSDIEKELAKLNTIAKNNIKLQYEGSYKIAIQEYVEAALYFHFVKTGELKDMKVLAEHYLLGLADLPGELVRKAVYLASKGKNEEVIKIRDQVDTIYGEMLRFDFRNGELRKKTDGIKYSLNKLEDLVLQLKLREN